MARHTAPTMADAAVTPIAAGQVGDSIKQAEKKNPLEPAVHAATRARSGLGEEPFLIGSDMDST